MKTLTTFLLSVITLQNFASATDSAVIHGKFIPPCSSPSIRIKEYNLMNPGEDEIILVKNGEFDFQVPNDVHQVYIKSGDAHLEILVSPKEKNYNVKFNCNEDGQLTMSIQGSHENDAFRKYYLLSRSFRDTIETFFKSNLNDPDIFKLIKGAFEDYQLKVAAIAKTHPQTFTGSVLCKAEILPASAFNSIAQLRMAYLQKSILANPDIYNNFYATRLIANYMYLIPENDTTFTPVASALSIAGKNLKAAKYLQQIVYDYFYNNRIEHLLKKYITWAEDHPDSMVNPVVKLQLHNLKNYVGGASFSEIQLNDDKGNQQSLSKTIVSAKNTLLVFYSPTCGHCREDIPKLKPLWDKYNSKGFKIYAVAFDAKKDDWNEFIEKYGSSEWINVIEPEGGNRPSAKYIISYTPMMILFDEKGKIITRFANVDYLSKEIPKRLD